MSYEDFKDKSTWERAKLHWNTLHMHRKLVREGCFAVGLYKQGLIHDLSKYSWPEFSVGVRYYQGDRSPNNAERAATGVTTSWLHHKGRNKHHFEYWIDYNSKKYEDFPLTGMKMPKKYVVEMAMDRIAACKVYQGENYSDASPLEYYKRGVSANLMYPDTSALLEKILTMLAEEGEKATFHFIKCKILRKNYPY